MIEDTGDDTDCITPLVPDDKADAAVRPLMIIIWSDGVSGGTPIWYIGRETGDPRCDWRHSPVKTGGGANNGTDSLPTLSPTMLAAIGLTAFSKI